MSFRVGNVRLEAWPPTPACGSGHTKTRATAESTGATKLMDTIEFRRILGHWTTGVSVVAARTAEGTLFGLTASAVSSVSLQPSLVLACIETGADTHNAIAAAGAFSINMLSAEQEILARRFAADDVVDKFEGVGWRSEVTGAPVLEDVLAWLDCTVWAQYPAGDHTIYIGEVQAGDAREGSPLVYYRGGFGRFQP